jgi:LuxR family maltose regulon positive regulatory protein
MDREEVGALLQAAKVELPDAEVADLVRRTEGWPVALDLAALSLKGTGAGATRGGTGSLLGDYLQSVLLSRLSASTLRFLTRTAVLDRLSGPLCDAVLEATGSAETLEWLERSNVLVVPLDRRGEWYRYHHLFREPLLAEFKRREPGLIGPLTGRAAAWCEQHGQTEAAVDYAMQAGDTDRAARLVTDVALATYGAGRLATLERWLAWFDRHGLVERYPAVAVVGAWVHALGGDAAAAESWAEAAERGSLEGVSSDGRALIEGGLTLLRAAMCRDGVEQARCDAELAEKLVPLGSPWRATALLLLGVTKLLVGEVDKADALLAEAVAVAEDDKATAAGVVALAERAVVAIGREDWVEAGQLVKRAQSVVRDARLDEDGTSALLSAVSAHLAIHRGQVPQARAELARARQQRSRLTYALPIYAVQTRLELAHAYLAMTDVAGARMMLREIDELLVRRPHLGVLGSQAEQLRARVDTMGADVLGAASLTAAELRLLPLLATHYSLREIGERLHRSHHTVKTQAVSIYRKLGVSSRSQAIRHAQQLGLLTA